MKEEEEEEEEGSTGSGDSPRGTEDPCGRERRGAMMGEDWT